MIKHRLKTGIISVAVMFGVAGFAQAQYKGPDQVTQKSIEAILKKPVDDQPVVLQGYLLRKVGNEKYIFSDGKSEIRVEIDDKDFPVESVDEKTLIEIHGEVEKDFLESPEIDVDRVVIVK